MSISEDPECGTKQKNDIFWMKIAETLHLKMGFCSNDRSSEACKKKFNIISKLCQEFGAFYGRIEASRPSGKSIDDYFDDAEKMWMETNQAKKNGRKGEFPEKRCFFILKNHPKWCQPLKKTQAPTDSETDSSIGKRLLEGKRPLGKLK